MTRWKSVLFGMHLALKSEGRLLNSESNLRKFQSGATRESDEGKYDYEAFFSPLVLERRSTYMHKHRVQVDGNVREGDNWQRGIPLVVYMKALWRHFFDVWKLHRGLTARTDMQDALCAVMFNTEGYLHELLKQELEDAGTDHTARERA